MKLFGGARNDARYKVHYEHPTQLLASTFLRAAAEGDLAAIWERLSSESRGLLEGRYASRAGLPLASVAGVAEDLADARLHEVVSPLRQSILRALGTVQRVNAMGVSAARLVSRREAFVLLLPDFGDERIVSEDDWRPGHLLGFVVENREWKVDIGTTALLSAEAELPDPLGAVR
jgi:hypothetical protein